ncbi:MAG TPA: SLC13 family permease [Syntrophomonadaceae bacterium]|nr:SLC13 family permease [Syntrophomonadaceae bacterium]
MIKITAILKKDPVFSVSLFLALLSSCFVRPSLADIDWRVLACLFNLSLIIAALEELKVLDGISIRLLSLQHNQRKLSVILVSFTFVSSMLITNDVALITFVPLTLIISRKAGFDPVYIVILQTLAANIGSSLTPMGNPQNLFLFSYYHIPLTSFLGLMLPLVIVGAFWLELLNRRVSNRNLNFDLSAVEIGDKRKVAVFILLFIVVVLAVLRLLDYRLVTVGVVLCTLCLDKTWLRKVDYLLLGTFACFFIFMGNLSHFTLLNELLQSSFRGAVRPLWASIFLSQVISNVPCAILIAHYTVQWKAVLLGVNVGGLGSLVASMASVIAYKFYRQEYKGHPFLVEFTGCNLLSLALFSTLAYCFLSF